MPHDSTFFSFEATEGKLFNNQKMLWRLAIDFRELQQFYDIDPPDLRSRIWIEMNVPFPFVTETSRCVKPAASRAVISRRRKSS